MIVIVCMYCLIPICIHTHRYRYIYIYSTYREDPQDRRESRPRCGHQDPTPNKEPSDRIITKHDRPVRPEGPFDAVEQGRRYGCFSGGEGRIARCRTRIIRTVCHGRRMPATAKPRREFDPLCLDHRRRGFPYIRRRHVELL